MSRKLIFTLWRQYLWVLIVSWSWSLLWLNFWEVFKLSWHRKAFLIMLIIFADWIFSYTGICVFELNIFRSFFRTDQCSFCVFEEALRTLIISWSRILRLCMYSWSVFCFRTNSVRRPLFFICFFYLILSWCRIFPSIGWDISIYRNPLEL